MLNQVLVVSRRKKLKNLAKTLNLVQYLVARFSDVHGVSGIWLIEKLVLLNVVV